METQTPKQVIGTDLMAPIRETLEASVNSGMLSQERASELFQAAFERQCIKPAHPPSQGGDSATAHIAEHNELKLYPYKASQMLAQRFRETRSSDLDIYKERFESLCAAGEITPQTSIMCFYLLYSDDMRAGVESLLHLSLFAPEGKRMAYYNWEVADTFDEASQHVYGPYIDGLPVPLVPGQKGRVKNDIILQRITDFKEGTLHGGSTTADIAAGIYRRPRDLIEGGGYMEPVINTEGEQVLAVNMEGTEARLLHLYKMLEGLPDDMAKRALQFLNASRGGRGAGRGAPPSGRGRSAGYGRARGGPSRVVRGGPWTHHGGETEEAEEPSLPKN